MATEQYYNRTPNPSYKNIGSVKFPRYSDSEPLTDANKEEALEAHRRAMFVIHKLKRDVPSFDEMKEVVMESSNKLAGIKEDMIALKNDHLEDIKKLSAEHTDEYNQEMMDRYVSNDESWYREDNNDAATSKLQEILYTGQWKDALMETRWRTESEQLNYSYTSQYLVSKTEQLNVEKQKEEERKRWEKEFPVSIDDFKKKGREVQLRTARYLVAGDREKEKMLTTFNWASRQTKPLETTFKHNESFSAEIRGLVLADVSSDPRIRH